MFVVPTSTRVAPLCSITSGIRNFPPISTSSPLETTTSPPLARELRMSMTAAALLFTAIAASAPVSRHRSCSKWEYLSPLFPASRLYSRLEYPLTMSAAFFKCSPEIGARPRLVCRIVPVPLITFLILGVLMALTRSSISAFSRSVLARASSSSRQAPIKARRASVSVRIASMTVSRL